jgi:D-alanyl-D-alanine carboxypeptidase
MKRSRKNTVAKNVIIVVLAILTLLLIVFIVSLFDNPPESESEPGSNSNVSGASTSKTEDFWDIFKAKTETTPPETEILIITTTAAETEAELADNEWALFLVNNENPIPTNYDEILEDDIGLTLVFRDYRDYYLDSRAAPYLERLLADSKEDGVDLYIMSTYRTQEYQQQNLDNSISDRMAGGMDYEAAYADAITNVAIPGKSEHNAGLAIDIMTPSYTSMDDDGFKNTPEYEWLIANAHKYGFILRYPEGKQDITGIIYEPWHYRFVGVYHATKIMESGLTLEEYFAENGWVDDEGKATEHLGPMEVTESVDGSNAGALAPITLPPDAVTVTVMSDAEPISAD